MVDPSRAGAKRKHGWIISAHLPDMSEMFWPPVLFISCTSARRICMERTMPIIIHCACGKTLQAPDTAVGKKVRCPECQAAVAVEARSAERSAAQPKATGEKPGAASKSAAPAPAKRGKGVMLALVAGLGLGLVSCLTCTGIGAFLAFRGGSSGLGDRLAGRWEVDVEASMQLRPDFRDPMGFFLAFARDGTGSYGLPGQERTQPWEIKGETLQGTEIWFKTPNTSQLYGDLGDCAPVRSGSLRRLRCSGPAAPQPTPTKAERQQRQGHRRQHQREPA
jgi:hypothetical protein